VCNFGTPTAEGRLSPHGSIWDPQQISPPERLRATSIAIRISPNAQGFLSSAAPHLQRDYKPHFITFCTEHRWILPDRCRTIVLDCCVHDHGIKLDVEVVVVMPDHVHMIFTALVNAQKKEIYPLAEIMDAIKGVSAHKINRILGRNGRVWQAESFDRVLRTSESLDQKVEYLMENPIRNGLVAECKDYPWLWRKPAMNPYAR
jgi:putative transposase